VTAILQNFKSGELLWNIKKCPRKSDSKNNSYNINITK